MCFITSSSLQQALFSLFTLFLSKFSANLMLSAETKAHSFQCSSISQNGWTVSFWTFFSRTSSLHFSTPRYKFCFSQGDCLKPKLALGPRGLCWLKALGEHHDSPALSPQSDCGNIVGFDTNSYLIFGPSVSSVIFIFASLISVTQYTLYLYYLFDLIYF